MSALVCLPSLSRWAPFAVEGGGARPSDWGAHPPGAPRDHPVTLSRAGCPVCMDVLDERLCPCWTKFLREAPVLFLLSVWAGAWHS